MHPTAGLGVALALAAGCGTALADARLDYATEGDCPTLFRSLEIAGPRLRIGLEPAGGEPLVSVFDGDEDLVTTMIPSQRRFLRMEVDADAADYSGDVASSSVVYLDKQMAKAAEAMREACKHGQCPAMPDFTAMLGRPQGSPIATREAGAETVGGFACTWREWLRDGAVIRRECLAEVASFPLPDADRAGLRRGLRVLTHYGNAMGAIRDRFVGSAEPVSPPGQLPVAQQCFAAGAATGSVMLTAREAPVDPARFEVPAGYSPAMGPGSDSP